jgi:peptidyl-tRNA hydrolase
MEQLKLTPQIDDPLVMYLVIPRALDMDVGKIGISCGHGVHLLFEWYMERQVDVAPEDMDACAIFWAWRKDKNYRKVSLSADAIEFAGVKQLPNRIIVVDHGYTEVPAESETCIGFWPMRKSQRPSLLASLKPLRSRKPK